MEEPHKLCRQRKRQNRANDLSRQRSTPRVAAFAWPDYCVVYDSKQKYKNSSSYPSLSFYEHTRTNPYYLSRHRRARCSRKGMGVTPTEWSTGRLCTVQIASSLEPGVCVVIPSSTGGTQMS